MVDFINSTYDLLFLAILYFLGVLSGILLKEQFGD